MSSGDAGRDRPRLAARLPLWLWTLFGAALVLLHVRDGSAAGLSAPLSAYSTGADRALYVAAFLLASFATLGLAVRRSADAGPSRARWLLVAASLGAVLVALLPSDGRQLATPADRIHAVGMAVWLTSCALLVVLRVPRSLALDRIGSALLRVVVLLLFVAVVSAKTLQTPALGLLQRLLVALLFASFVPLFLARGSRSDRVVP